MPNQSAREEKRAAKHLIRHAYALIYIAPLIDPNYPSFRCTISNRSTPNHSIIWNRATADITEMNLSNERAPMPALVSVPISNIDNTVSDIVHYKINKYAKQAQAAPVSRRPARVLCGSDSIAGNRRAGYAEHLGEVPARHARPHQRDRPDPQRRAAVVPRSARLPLVRCVPLVKPLVESLPRGVPRLAGRVHDGPSAFLDHLDGLALFLCRVTRHLPLLTGPVRSNYLSAPPHLSNQAMHS